MNVLHGDKYRAYIDEIDEDLRSTIKKGLDFINWDTYIDKKSVVFVKPNFTFPHYREGVTTSPSFLRCLLELLVGKAGTVIVGESDGANHAFTAEEAFSGHNMYQICRETGVELVSLSKLPSKTIKEKILGKTVEVKLPKLLLEEIDCFISIPTLKVHARTTISLSLKNSWGCVPDTMRCLHHQNLPYKLALIAKWINPKIIVIDGTYALNKHGPMFGEPVKTNLILVADNTVVADALGTSIMGFLPKKIRHISVAERSGLGSADLTDIIINKDWQQYKRQFQIKKTLVDRASGLLFYSDALAKLVMDSPLTPGIYKFIGMLRTSDEKEISSQLSRRKSRLLY